MPLWKQLAISIALLFVALCSWVYFSPGAGQTLVSMGVPQSVVALVSGQPDGEGQQAQGQSAQGAGQGRVQGQGQGGRRVVPRRARGARSRLSNCFLERRRARSAGLRAAGRARAAHRCGPGALTKRRPLDPGAPPRGGRLVRRPGAGPCDRGCKQRRARRRHAPDPRDLLDLRTICAESACPRPFQTVRNTRLT